MSKRLLLFGTALVLLSMQARAQSEEWKAFRHLDLGLSVGTTGYGLELAAPVCDFLKVRTGINYLPSVEVPMHFDIMVGNDPKTSQSKFNRMAGLLESLTGQKVDSQIDMIGKPMHFWNWDVLFDLYPLKNNKHWRITAGFYLGAKHIAKAYNTTEDMPSLMAVGMYNSMYDKLINDQIEAVPELLYEQKIIDLSSLGEEYTSSTDPMLLEALQEKFKNAGRMGVHVGDYVNDVYYPDDVIVGLPDDDGNIYDEEGNFINPVVVHHKGDVMYKAGDPYIMEPDENGMVKATMTVNRFKPYLGFGYEGRLIKGDDRYKIAVDAGVMFWGGAPSVTTHEGVDLINDVENIGGKVGSYVDAINKFKVFPMVSLRLTRRLF